MSKLIHKPTTEVTVRGAVPEGLQFCLENHNDISDNRHFQTNMALVLESGIVIVKDAP